ncbi:MAG: DUF4105 domain-containing protein [Xanthomonadales bacterium]|nr:DUF4105 domain-containing protein [Xanthomonadales bacterium]
MSWKASVIRAALLLILLASTPIPLRALEPGVPVGYGPEIWLVSYGPGEVYWQRFGHNAIWVRDPALGLDHVFNFGFFDFGQENFFLRFLQGRMLYFSAAQPASEEFAGYIDENRSIRAQRLALSERQATELAAYLLEEVRPENRDYLYDYYANNCATRVRDALDQALDGVLQQQFAGTPAPQTWRDHTRRLTAADFWLYLGLEIVLGAPVDRPIDRWEEMFIPAVLADALMEVEAAPGGGVTGPLVREDVTLYASTLQPPPPEPRAWWPRYLLASLGVVAAAWLLARSGPAWLGPLVARSWLGLGGVAGLAMLFFWFGTDHAVASLNLNLLVFSPLWLWPALFRSASGRTTLLVGGLSALALAMPFLPPWQYSFDVLAAFRPLNLAAAAAVDRQPRSARR